MAPPAVEKTVFSGRPSHPEVKESRFWGWFAFSALVHGIIVLSLFVMPYVPSRRLVTYPAYTVDLVGGEKLGGGAATAALTPTPEPKKEKALKNKQVEPAARLEESPKEKKEKRKVVESDAKTPEKVALKKSKAETKREQRKEQGLSGAVREKLYQAALERVKERATTESKSETGERAASVPGAGEGPGASAPGQGGTGGGMVRGVEFLIYYNRMLQLIKEQWTWVGKKSDLVVIVRYSVQEDGEITGLKIVQRSGQASYDDSVVRAVKKVSPLPPPPESYRKDYMDVEISFREKDLRD
jgi:colicin import membrane protein